MSFDLLDVASDTPQLISAMLTEILSEISHQRLKPLPHTVFSLSEAVQAFRYLAQARQIGKVIISQSDPSSLHSPGLQPIRNDSTYLITGGLGGLGLQSAAWLVEQGASHLALIGRQGISDQRTQEVIRRLEQQGTHVLVYTVDVTDREALSQTLDTIRVSMPPLRGILHAAGVLDDGILAEQNWERFAHVLAPKIAGSWNLHQLTQDLSLDFFVCFSSLASLIGSPGQGNYAAANAFMDALMCFRSSQGFPGLSINWGPWAETGMAVQHEKHLTQRGLLPLPPRIGFRALASLLGQGPSTDTGPVAVSHIDWERLLRHLPSENISPFLSEVSNRGTQQNVPVFSSRSSLSVLHDLREALPEERQGVLIIYLTETAAQVLGLAPAQLNAHQPLDSLGLDSLMAVELSNQIQTACGTQLSPADLMEETSIASLATQLDEQLFPSRPLSDEPFEEGGAAQSFPLDRSLSGISSDTKHSSAPAFHTLVELLRWRAMHQPHQRAYTFLLDGRSEEKHIAYCELDRQARAIAAWLQSHHAAGERVLLLFPEGLEYIAAFMGCLYAGAIAVPAYPPRINRHLERVRSIAVDARAAFALTQATRVSKRAPIAAQTAGLDRLTWLILDDIPHGIQEQWQDPLVTGDSLAYLQYTSGSTSAPKGVMISHANILHNEQAIQTKFQTTSDSISVSWAPPYHDLGLIEGLLQPLYVGFPCVLLSPLYVMQRPLLWLQAISHYRATLSGGPNFAYDLSVRRISPQDKEALDLSCWQIAFNGSEPVNPQTLVAFSEYFAPQGFRPQAWYPSYGLAEATLLVSAGEQQEAPILKYVEKVALEEGWIVEGRAGDKSTIPLVGCGRSLPDQEIMIVRPADLSVCDPDEIGEIVVSGPSVTQGYWDKLEETQKTFPILGDTGNPRRFLRTGDLGFVHNGELFVTGRIKDLIIIQGRNLYPQDIERTVAMSWPGLSPNGAAAFSLRPVPGVEDETLVVIQEVGQEHRAESRALIRAIHRAIAEEYGVRVERVVLIKAGTLPRTSSGKVQRFACREQFLSGTLVIVEDLPGQTHREEGSLSSRLEQNERG